MIVVAGHLRVAPADRDGFVERSREANRVARATCLDFVVAPDPLDDGRVDFYERWIDRRTLRAFRGAGPKTALREMIQH